MLGMRRKIPWILAFEAVMAMRAHWRALPPADRVRLTELARKSQGRPMRLTRAERAEFRRIARGLDMFGLAREMAPFGGRARRRR
jgi:hypothetical protein